MPPANHTRVTAVLRDAWAKFQLAAPALPPACIVVDDADDSPRPTGQPEVVIDHGTVNSGPLAVLAALAHDAAHLLAEARGISDTSDRGRYHNGHFADLVKELGFAYEERGGRVGTPRVHLSLASTIAYNPILSRLSRNLPVNKLEPSTPHCYSQRNHRNPDERLKATCLCVPPRIVRVGARVLAAGPITCGICEADFEDRG